MSGFVRFRIAEVKKNVVKKIHHETHDYQEAIIEYRASRRQGEEEVELLGTKDNRFWNILPNPDPQHALGGFE